jgi:hypothetical protein
MWNKGNIVHCLLECKLVQTLWKALWRFLQKIKIELPLIQQYHSWAYIESNVNGDMIGTLAHPCFRSIIHNKQPMEMTQMFHN